MSAPEHGLINEVGVLVSEYEQFLSDKAPGTREAYLRTVRHLIGWLIRQHPGCAEPFQPQQLTQSDVQMYLTHLEQEGLSLHHRARVKSTISHFARFLIEEKELLQRNPTRGIDLPPVTQPAPQLLSREQRTLLRSLVEQEGDLRGAALFALVYWAGCRVSDLSWLCMEDAHVGPTKGWLQVGYKEGVRRTIDLLNKACKPLFAYLQATREIERAYVFISQRSERLTEEAIHYWFRTLKSQAAEDQREVIADLTLHDLRCDFAHRARETGGWSPEEVMSYLGLGCRQGASVSF